MTIVNDDSRVITKLETSLTDDARVVIYDHHMFILQAIGEYFRRYSSFLSLEQKSWSQRNGVYMKAL